jgi:hypothetical protein
MNIKQITFSVVTALVVAVAASVQAGTVFDFGPASYCPTYCTGFTTDNPAYTVDYINPRYNNTTIVSVNGVVYRGPMAWVAIGTNGTHTVCQESVVLTATDGRYIMATITEEYWVTVVNSGRAHGYLPHNYVTGGTITIP